MQLIWIIEGLRSGSIIKGALYHEQAEFGRLWAHWGHIATHESISSRRAYSSPCGVRGKGASVSNWCRRRGVEVRGGEVGGGMKGDSSRAGPIPESVET